VSARRGSVYRTLCRENRVLLGSYRARSQEWQASARGGLANRIYNGNALVGRIQVRIPRTYRWDLRPRFCVPELACRRKGTSIRGLFRFPHGDLRSRIFLPQTSCRAGANGHCPLGQVHRTVAHGAAGQNRAASGHHRRLGRFIAWPAGPSSVSRHLGELCGRLLALSDRHPGA